MESFEFHFTPTQMDFANVMRISVMNEWSHRQFGFRAALVATPVLLVTLLLAISSIGAGNLSCLLPIVGLYVCAGTLVGVGLLIGPIVWWNLLDPDGRHLVEMRYAITNDSIRMTTPTNEVRTVWANVREMIENKHYFIFPTSTRLGSLKLMAEVHFVPKRAFESVEREEQFRKFVLRKIRQWSGTANQ